MPIRSFTGRVMLALLAGIALGLLVNESRWPLALMAAGLVEPLGTLFIDAIRMTVIPLVFSLLIVGIATADAHAIRRLGARALGTALVLLVVAALVGAIVGPLAFRRLRVSPDAVASLGAATRTADAAESTRQSQSFAHWLIDLVPTNPVRAAADGAMLPLIVFAIALGLALLALAEDRRDPVVRFFRGVADAMLVLVRWVLALAPIGVFALALPLVARLGLSAVGALALYVAALALASTVYVLLVVYPAVAIAGRIPLARFARAVFPAQAVAFSSRSSLAALPALIEEARDQLGISPEATNFLLPVASALVRVGAALGLTMGAIFLGYLYRMPLSSMQIATVALTVVLSSVSVPGVPAGWIVAMVPVLSSVGLPLQGIGVLLGIDTIPDAFRTTANVTGQMAVAAIASDGRRDEWENGRESGAGAPPARGAPPEQHVTPPPSPVSHPGDAPRTIPTR